LVDQPFPLALVDPLVPRRSAVLGGPVGVGVEPPVHASAFPALPLLEVLVVGLAGEVPALRPAGDRTLVPLFSAERPATVKNVSGSLGSKVPVPVAPVNASVSLQGSMVTPFGAVGYALTQPSPRGRGRETGVDK